METQIVAPKCPLFGTCGGCSSQHIPYEVQVENKKKQVESLLRRARPDWTGELEAVAGAPFEYRNRMDFVFSPSISGVGLRVKGKWWDIVPVPDCPISNTSLNTLLQEVNDWAKETNGLQPFDIKKSQGTLRYAVIRTNKNGSDSSISFVLNEDSSRLQEHIEKIKAFAEHTSAKHVVITYVPAKNDMSISTEHFAVKESEGQGEDGAHDDESASESETLTETFLGRAMRYPVQGFFQNNPAMAERMLTHTREILQREIKDKAGAYIADIYGGVGTFAIAVADLCALGITVESFEESTQFARKNLDENGFTHMKSVCIDAAQLKKLELEKKAAGKDLFLILDPPRSGMHPKTILEINRLGPRLIVYISCNPEQLAKELVGFKSHSIESVTVFDLFPQTPHVETVVVLKKK